MKYKPRKVLIWLAMNAGIGSCAVAGSWFGVVWAGNLFKFALWLFVIFYAITAANKGSVASLRKSGGSVPSVVALLYDLLLAGTLAAAGWFFYASLQVVQLVLALYLTVGGEDEEQNEVEVLVGAEKR